MALLEKLKTLDYRYKIGLVAFLTIFIGPVIGALVSELKTVVDFISWPLVTFSTSLHPISQTPDFLKIVYAALCLIFYVSLITFPFYCISAIRNGQSNKDSLEVELYTKEIAATLGVLERTNSQRDHEEALENFLRNISNKIIDSFPKIRMSSVRYAFLLSPPNTSNREYSTVKFGRNGSLTDDDHKVIEWILIHTEEDFYINGDVKADVSTVTAGYDIEAVALVRNGGDDFRFGFAIFFPSQEALQNQVALDEFVKNSSVIRVFAYMDTLWNSMVEYSYTVTRNGGGGSNGGTQ